MEYISDHQKTIFQALKVAFYNSNTLLNCVFLFYTPLYENEQKREQNKSMETTPAYLCW